MLKICFFSACCFLLFTANIFGQACGTGYFQITLNTKDPVDYKLFPVAPKDTAENMQKTVAEFFFPNEEKKDRFWHSMPKVDASVAEQFLADYKPENYEAVYRDLPTAGTSRSGVIRLTTAEAYAQPFLMKLSAENYRTVYYLGSFLGGCKTKKSIDLENE